MSVLIRRMEPDDIPVLAALERTSFSDPWSENAFRAEWDNPHGITLVAEQDGMIVGYLNAHHLFENVHINTFLVYSMCRRQGTGGRLLQTLLELAQNAGALELTLEVRQGNGAAIGLYRKHGFAPVGCRKRFYREPEEDAVLMKRELNSF